MSLVSGGCYRRQGFLKVFFRGGGQVIFFYRLWRENSPALLVVSEPGFEKIR